MGLASSENKNVLCNSGIVDQIRSVRRIKTKGAVKMLIKHRLGDLIREFGLKISYISSIVEEQSRHADQSEEGVATGEKRLGSLVLCGRRPERPA